jgi:hypothetical protein
MNPKEIEKYTEDDYDDMLDEVYGDIEIGNLTYSTSRVLKEIDPIAYDYGFSDYQEYVYECSECGETFEDEQDAEECCRENQYQCEICEEYHDCLEDAEECCLEDKVLKRKPYYNQDGLITGPDFTFYYEDLPFRVEYTYDPYENQFPTLEVYFNDGDIRISPDLPDWLEDLIVEDLIEYIKYD